MQPTVCCVMLANGREAMVRRAVRAFQAQTYPHKRLLIWDTGELNQDLDTTGDADEEIAHIPAEAYRSITIGALRNEAIAFWTEYPIILHWDSDDWSHPQRIAEQVALLQASGKEVVGYRDMLFYVASERSARERGGEAWLYTNRNPTYCIGTSLCYWRRVWEQKPFPDTNAGEDTMWLMGLQSMGILSLLDEGGSANAEAYDGRTTAAHYAQPRMIASIHGGNTHAHIDEHAEEWRRVPEWDKHCREVMAL